MKEHPWVKSSKLAVKVDQLIKRRGKNGLIKVNVSFEEAVKWISEMMNTSRTVEGTTGVLNNFLIEPLVPHKQSEEYYLCIHTDREGDEILFHHEGGVDVGDVDAKATRVRISEDQVPSTKQILDSLLHKIKDEKRKKMVASYVQSLLLLYRDLHFCYFEINPLVCLSDRVVALDVASVLDETAEYLCHEKWGNDLTFATPFGRPPAKEEAYIRSLDAKTGASLKLTLLNRKGRVWNLVAGGGASVVYADTICDLGFGSELANYGEYSGAPTETMTYEYAQTILDLMTQGPVSSDGKVLIIGGGIANFTDVAATFKGIIRALLRFKEKLIQHKVRIYVRRGGPNYKEGLANMRNAGKKIGVPMFVHGPETDIVEIVPKALSTLSLSTSSFSSSSSSKCDDDGVNNIKTDVEKKIDRIEKINTIKNKKTVSSPPPLTSSSTRCIVYGMQRRAVQGMLDFDYLCKRESPSVAAIVFPFSANHFQQFYFGAKEVQIPVRILF